jgi:hypothetical protein
MNKKTRYIGFGFGLLLYVMIFFYLSDYVAKIFEQNDSEIMYPQWEDLYRGLNSSLPRVDALVLKFIKLGRTSLKLH